MPRRELFAQAGQIPRLTLASNQLLRPTEDRNSLAIRPDGRRFAYVANNRLYLENGEPGEATEIAGSAVQQGVSSPLFSPDAQTVVFRSAQNGRGIKSIPVGGAAKQICAADNP